MKTLITCDCTAADNCPQGHIGMQGKCSIWIGTKTPMLHYLSKVEYLVIASAPRPLTVSPRLTQHERTDVRLMYLCSITEAVAAADIASQRAGDDFYRQ